MAMLAVCSFVAFQWTGLRKGVFRPHISSGEDMLIWFRGGVGGECGGDEGQSEEREKESVHDGKTSENLRVGQSLSIYCDIPGA